MTRALRTTLIAAALSIFTLALTGPASAATGFVGKDGLIHGCVTKKGQLVLLKATKRKPKCKRGQKALTWSVQGPAGAPGGNGSTGPTGPAGAQGPKGDTGPSTGAAGGDLTGNYPDPAIAAGAVDSGKVKDGSLTAADTDTTSIQARATGSCTDSNVIQSIAESGALGCAAVWQLGGNAGTTPGTDYLGTSDSQPLEIKVNGQRALRLEPTTVTTFFGSVNGAPNVIGGYSGNSVTAGVSSATIAGGGFPATLFTQVQPNQVTGTGGAVVGGAKNSAGQYAVAGGSSNTASGTYATALGLSNTASGTGSYAIGTNSTVAGQYSFGGGNTASVPSGHDGTFVWADGNGGTFASTGANQFDVRATNGVEFQTNSGNTYSTGCKIAAGGGAWACTSDRNAKRGFTPISDSSLLAALDSIPIETWSYKSDPRATRHLGPTAQDFKHAFHVGDDSRSIGVLDEGGVALAGVQGLYRQVRAQQREIRRLTRMVRALSSARSGG